jgi:Activator of Hsp90 ATPase homolog 1-like protein
MTIKNSAENKSLKTIWYDNNKSTIVLVNFFDKGKDKTQVMIEHSKLDRNPIEEMKQYWETSLSKLDQI